MMEESNDDIKSMVALADNKEITDDQKIWMKKIFLNFKPDASSYEIDNLWSRVSEMVGFFSEPVPTGGGSSATNPMTSKHQVVCSPDLPLTGATAPVPQQQNPTIYTFNLPVNFKLEQSENTNSERNNIVLQQEAQTTTTTTAATTRNKKDGKDVPYQCNICNKTFAVPARLTRHYRTHTGERPYQCEFCDKKFGVKENLSVHRRIHTKERPYKCDVCERAFEHSGKLHRHMRIHTGERPHACSVCQKTFIQSGQLVIHMRTHTGEKPYVCQTCKKGFTCSKQLKVHTRSHSGEKPYSCEICGKSFGYNHVLKVHLVAHYSQKVYKCTICDGTFTSKKNLETHIKTHSQSDQEITCTDQEISQTDEIVSQKEIKHPSEQITIVTNLNKKLIEKEEKKEDNTTFIQYIQSTVQNSVDLLKQDSKSNKSPKRRYSNEQDKKSLKYLKQSPKQESYSYSSSSPPPLFVPISTVIINNFSPPIEENSYIEEPEKNNFSYHQLKTNQDNYYYLQNASDSPSNQSSDEHFTKTEPINISPVHMSQVYNEDQTQYYRDIPVHYEQLKSIYSMPVNNNYNLEYENKQWTSNENIILDRGNDIRKRVEAVLASNIMIDEDIDRGTDIRKRVEEALAAATTDDDNLSVCSNTSQSREVYSRSPSFSPDNVVEKSCKSNEIITLPPRKRSKEILKSMEMKKFSMPRTPLPVVGNFCLTSIPNVNQTNNNVRYSSVIQYAGSS